MIRNQGAIFLSIFGIGSKKNIKNQLFRISKNSILNKFRYRYYRKLFDRISNKLINDSNYINLSKQNLIKISKGIPEHYILSLSQLMTTLNIKHLTKLEEKITIDNDTIDEYKTMYDDGCTCLEKFIKIDFYFLDNLLNQTRTFESIQKNKTYNIKQKLIAYDSNYEKFLKPFSTIIWNSIKHGEVMKNPSKEKIVFKSHDGNIILSYSKFVKMTGELFVLIFLISRYQQFLLLKKQIQS